MSPKVWEDTWVVAEMIYVRIHVPDVQNRLFSFSSENSDDFGGGTIDVQLEFETKVETPTSPTASRNQNKTHRRERTFSASSNKGTISRSPPTSPSRKRAKVVKGIHRSPDTVATCPPIFRLGSNGHTEQIGHGHT